MCALVLFFFQKIDLLGLAQKRETGEKKTKFFGSSCFHRVRYLVKYLFLPQQSGAEPLSLILCNWLTPEKSKSRNP